MQWVSVDLVNFTITREFIHKKTPVPVDDATQVPMQHGIQHEVSDFCMCI